MISMLLGRPTKSEGCLLMRIGILADIHESLTNLRWAIDVLHEQGADRLVVLGDVFELGHRLKETVDLLADAGAVGVWGNHDFGLCRDNARPEDRERYGERVLAFMGCLQPRMEIDGCQFAHVEPWVDAERIEDLWYFEGLPETTDRVARSFAAVPNRLIFVGHFHRWLMATPEGLQPWVGDRRVARCSPFQSRCRNSRCVEPVLRVCKVTLEKMSVDKDWFDEDQLPGGTGMSAYLMAKVSSTPVGTSDTPITFRITSLCLATVIDDDILLELDEVDLGVEQMPRTVCLGLVCASCVSYVPFVGLGIDGSAIPHAIVRHQKPEI